MPYESLFWSMAAIVAFALCAGVLAGCLKTLGATLSGVVLAAAWCWPWWFRWPRAGKRMAWLCRWAWPRAFSAW